MAAVCQKQEEVLVTHQAVLSKHHEQETMPDIQLPRGFNRRGLLNLGNRITEHGTWVFRRSADEDVAFSFQHFFSLPVPLLASLPALLRAYLIFTV